MSYITNLYCKKNNKWQNLRIKKEWNGSTIVNYTSNNIHNKILDMNNKKEISLYEIKSFQANNKIIHIKNLYKKGGPYYCCFRKSGNEQKLLVTGCKTAQEFVTIGHDMFYKSKVPIILTVKDQHFQALNL